MRRAARIDANQLEIVGALRRAGRSVQSLAALGHGVPDLLVSGYCPCGRAANLLLEVKDGQKTPSKRSLTEDEAKWHQSWRGPVAVVLDAPGAIAATSGGKP